MIKRLDAFIKHSPRPGRSSNGSYLFARQFFPPFCLPLHPPKGKKKNVFLPLIAREGSGGGEHENKRDLSFSPRADVSLILLTTIRACGAVGSGPSRPPPPPTPSTSGRKQDFRRLRRRALKMARSAKGVRGLFVWHDLYWGGKHAAGEGAGAGTGAAGRGAPGMFLPGREPEDAGPGNRPRPAAAGPGAGGSGRLPAGRRREGSGLAEPGEPGARDPSGARARCGPLPPPLRSLPLPLPARAAEASAAPGSAPGARRAAKPGPDGVCGSRDVAALAARGGRPAPAASTGLEELQSCQSGPGRRKGSARGQSHVCGCRDLKMDERPETVSGKVIFSRFREVVTAPHSKSGGGCASISGREEDGKARPDSGKRGPWGWTVPEVHSVHSVPS